ncbi:COG4315 family predicted lipoprotein [Actinomadura decatromicini]|uniref:COG4315 family predicted lipoprotein n=1 Tax=Actinomadura decatromicini TaxID=2604572 RepID=UPI001CA34FE3|nr:hypothetical protein [Actinomadura decatromicini]
MSQAHKTDPAHRPRRRRIVGVPLAAAALAAALLEVAGCGDGDSSATNQAATATVQSPAPSQTGAATGETIKTATVGNLGQILVDGEGRTVYLFEKDTGTASTCSGSCAAVWPPVATSGKPQAGPGADATKLGTTRRGDGSAQVTYGGHPIYYYAPDGTSPGSAKGQGLNQFGAKWYVLSASGNKVQSTGGGSNGGGY